MADRRLGSLAELVARPGMPSGPSMHRFIEARADFPIVERGAIGRRYLIDLDAAEAFVRAHWRDGRHDRRDGRRHRADPSQPYLFDLGDVQ